MSVIHRGRAFVRAGWRDQGRTLQAIVGVVETDAGHAEHEVHGYAAVETRAGMLLTPTGHRSKPEYMDDVVGAQIEHALTGMQWPRPAADTGLAGGGLMLRRTRAPAAAGRAIAIVAGVFCDVIALEDQTMVTMSGDLATGVEITSSTCARHLETNGTTLSQIMQRPLWGWDEEPWGLFSTLDLDTIDACSRMETLMEDEVANAAAIDAERGSPAWSIVRSSIRDERYREFRRRLRAETGGERWDRVDTARDIEARERRAERIIRAMDIA